MKIAQIPNRIIKQPLQGLNINKVDSIALHHMASDLDVKGIERAHINQGWRAIGYNFWVAFDGTVYEGRGFNLGAGVEGHNGHIISIGFQGDYHSKERKMPDEQFNSGVVIINYVLSKVPSIKTID
ncbi:MAG: N-acetylmuramoyl-L-alanine amidase, partial [Clostridia bacterium]|nr:N-acetylmuramoyl-L-alanine amidase [Clostridia bacterium]